MLKLDEKDFAILEILKGNSRLSTQKIARAVRIPVTTVHNRVKKLVKEKVIKNYTINIDSKKLGKAVSSYVFITVDYKALKESKMSQIELAKKIKSNPIVVEASILTGGTDILIKVNVSSIEELSDFVTNHLRKFGGVDATSTAVILAEV